MEEREQREQEAALRESERRFRDLFEGIPACCWVFDREGTILHWNRACEELYGWTAEQAIGKTMYDLMVKDENVAPTREKIAAVFQGQSFHGIEYEDLRADGTTCDVLVSEYPLKDASGQVVMGICAELDITERKRAEKALKDAEREKETILDSQLEHVVYQDREHRILWLNRAACESVGATREELIGRYCYEVWAQRSERCEDCPVALAMETGQPQEIEKTTPDGRAWFIRGSLVRDASGEVVGGIEVTQEITERKRAEEELIRLSNAVRMSTDSIVISDLDGKIIDVNEATLGMHGTDDKADLIGKSSFDLIAPEDREKAFVGAQEVLEKGYAKGQEYHIITQNGSRIPVEMSVAIMKDAAGEPIGFVGVTRDITERKRAEEELHRRATQQVALNAIIAAATAAPDLPNLLETALDHTLQALRLEMGDIWTTGQHVLRGIPPEIGPAMIRTVRAASVDIPSSTAVEDWQEEVSGPYSALAPLMARFGIRASVVVPILVEGRRIGGLALAASEPRPWGTEEMALVEAVGRQLGGAVGRLRLLAQVQEQARQVRQIMDMVPEGVLLLDADGQVILANPVAEKDLAILAGARIGDTLTHLGDRSLAELLTPPPKGLWHEVVIAGRRFEVIARLLEAGLEPEGWVLVIRDVTREREIQQRIQQQERLASVGQLAAGIAHDFNNIMATIVLYAQMLSRMEDLSPRDREWLATVNRQAKQATGLVQQILDFSRRSVLERRPLDLSPLLKEHVKLLERTLPENIEIKLVYGRDEYTVYADPTRMQQVMMNLGLNARDAMPEGGKLRFGLERVPTLPPGLRPSPPQAKETEGGEWVQVTVSDTGIGIPPDVLPHIFDPFCTTKAPGEGSGLGLAQVYGIVKQHEGEIDVQSQAGQGTTFTVYMPALPVHPAEAVDRELPPLAKGQGETVLVVEDDRATREALVDSLELLNYRVLAAANGREALAILERQTSEVSEDFRSLGVALVLSDVVMPGMGGIELLQALKERGLAVRVVMLTGHPLEEELESLRAQGMSDWLFKPPSLEQLAEVVARALDEK